MAFLDDDDAFEAALSFLDAYELEEATTEGREEEATPRSSGAESKQGDEKLRRKKLPNERRKMLRRTGIYGDPNQSRNGRKMEISFLREHLQQLQLNLESLRSKAAERSKEQEGEHHEEVALPKVWQEIATHQRRRRVESEGENIRLRLVVEQQKKVSDSLRSLLRKRATCLMKEYSAFADSALSAYYVDQVLDFREDLGEFQGLFRHLDEARLQLDTMLLNNGMANMTISPIDVHIREDIHGNHTEFFTYKELPFGLRETTDVSWDHWKGVEKHIMGNGGLYQKAARALDQPYTIVEDFTKELYSEHRVCRRQGLRK